MNSPLLVPLSAFLSMNSPPFIGGVEKVNFLCYTPKSPSLAPPKRLREGEGGTY